MANCSVSTKVCFLLVGAGIGAAVVLLFAPKSGKETRKLIADKAEDGKDYVALKGKEVREKAEKLVDKGMQVVAKQKERLAEALEAGKQAARTTFARQ